MLRAKFFYFWLINHHMMPGEWVKIYAATEVHKIEIVKAMLEENDIPSFEINKKDSSYISVGESELYVRASDEIIARLIINNQNI